MKKLRFQVFVDPIYAAERSIEFAPEDVVEVRRQKARLFLRGRHPVTFVKLKSGAEYRLKGEVAAEIEAALSKRRV